MIVNRRYTRSCLTVSIFTTVLFVGGCGHSNSPVPKVTTAAAKTTHPVSEAQLNTIELTEEAVRRLGLKTAAVEQRSLPRSRVYGAEVVLPNGAAVIVSAPMAGTLQGASEGKFPHVGQRVKEGELILKLLPLLSPETRNALTQSQNDADAQVEQALIQLNAAQVALERAEKLMKESVGTIRAVDEAKAQHSLAKKALDAAQTRKKQVDQLGKDDSSGEQHPLILKAPLDGIVRTTQAQPGQVVGTGAGLFEVMNDAQLWIKVPVYVGELDKIDSSKTAKLSQLDGRLRTGDVDVKPALLPLTALASTATVDMYYELPNAEHRFRPGQKVSAYLPLIGETQQTALPWSAVIHDIYGGQWVFEQTEDRKFVRRRVEVSWVDGDWAVILRGPKLGAQVVTAGAAELAGTEFGFAK